MLPGLLFIVISNLKLGTIGGKSRRQRRTYAWTEVATDNSCTEQTYLRLLFFEEIYEDICMGCRGIRKEVVSVKDV